MPISSHTRKRLRSKSTLFLGTFVATLITGLVGNLVWVLGFLAVLPKGSHELVDKAFFASLVLVATFLLYPLLIKKREHSLVLQDLSSGEPSGNVIFFTFFVSIITVAVPTNLYLPDQLGFMGLGLKVALAFGVVWLLLRHPQSSEIVFENSTVSRLFFWTFLIACLVISFQPSWGLSDSFHSLWVLNDLAFPTWGANNFVPQYALLQGLISVPLLTSVEAFSIPLLSLLLSAFSFITVLAYSLTAKALNRGSISFGLVFLVFPILLASNSDTGLGSILSSSSVVGVRLVFPLLSLWMISQYLLGTFRPHFAGLAGALSALALLNNLEFGLVSTLAIFAGLFFSPSLRARGARAFSLGYIMTLAVGAVFAITFGLVDDFFARLKLIATFANGFGGGPFQILGFHLILFPFFFYLTIRYSARVMASKMEGNPYDNLGMILSLFGMGSLLYYMTVSSSSVQMQASFFAFGLLSANLFGELQGKSFERGSIHDGSKLLTALLALGVSISVAALPSFRTELIRLSPNTATELQGSYSNVYLENTIHEAKMLGETHEGRIAVYVVWGNLVQAGSGAVSLSVTTDPREEALFGFSQTCERFQGFDFVIAVREHDGEPNETVRACGFEVHNTLNPGMNDFFDSSSDAGWKNDLWKR